MSLAAYIKVIHGQKENRKRRKVKAMYRMVSYKQFKTFKLPAVWIQYIGNKLCANEQKKDINLRGGREKKQEL